MSPSGENIDPKASLFAQFIGKVAGAGADKAINQARIVVDQSQGDAFGLKWGCLTDNGDCVAECPNWPADSPAIMAVSASPPNPLPACKRK